MISAPEQEEPLVSVVTAALNALPGLRRTVESVAGQTMGDCEHIVVDGGSSDGTQRYLERLGPSVRWISEPDEGIADALNKGVAMARGSFVLVLQAEDTFADRESLAEARPRLRRGLDVLVCDVVFGQGERARLVAARASSRRLRFKPVCHQGVFTRRDLFERIGGFDPSFGVCMDYDFLVRACLGGARIEEAPVTLSRMSDGGVSSRRDWPSLARRFAEERRVHLAHCPRASMRAIYAVYWPTYLAYRRIRAVLSSTPEYG